MPLREHSRSSRVMNLLRPHSSTRHNRCFVLDAGPTGLVSQLDSANSTRSSLVFPPVSPLLVLHSRNGVTSAENYAEDYCEESIEVSCFIRLGYLGLSQTALVYIFATGFAFPPFPSTLSSTTAMTCCTVAASTSFSIHIMCCAMQTRATTSVPDTTCHPLSAAFV